MVKPPVDNGWHGRKVLLNFDEVREVAEDTLNTGVGIRYNDAHPYVCIDIDDFSEENRELMTHLASYTELSPSKSGCHVVVKCIDKEELVKHYGRAQQLTNSGRDLFVSTGYVTMTGVLEENSASEIAEFSFDELNGMLESYFNKGTADPVKHEPTDAELFEEAVAEQPRYSPVSAAKAKSLLRLIPVRSLKEDTFSRLLRGEQVLLDYNSTEEAYTPWLIVGQALHHNFKGGLDGFLIWDEWSKQGSKYDQATTEKKWLSFKDFKNPITIGAVLKLVNAQRPVFPDVNKKGALLGTVNNFSIYLEFYGFMCYFNEITKEAKVDIPENVLRRWQMEKLAAGYDMSLSEISEYIVTDLCTMGFSPSSFGSGKIKKFLSSRCKTKITNPIRRYFEECGKKWDKRDHLGELCDTIVPPASHKQYKEVAYKHFIRKWLIQVVAAACHDTNKPVRLNRVLVFVGPQDVGKTKWIESLFPSELQEHCASKRLNFGNFRSDDVKLTMELSGMLICNLNEIDAYFSKKGSSEFKEFLDRTTDRVVLPYGESATKVSRRTVFAGSANKTEFLRDMTGNRRYELIHVESLEHGHNISIDQLWGQLYHIYQDGERWWFDKRDPKDAPIIQARDAINTGALAAGSEAVVEKLYYAFDVERAARTEDWRPMTLKDIRIILGYDSVVVNSMLFREIKYSVHTWSKQVSGRDPKRGSGVRALVHYWMPPLREDSEGIALPDEEPAEGREEALKRRIAEMQAELERIIK